MSILDSELEENIDKTIIEGYVREWLKENTYTRWTGGYMDMEREFNPEIIVHDNNIVDLEYPHHHTMVIQGEIEKLPYEIFTFGKIGGPISLGENYQNFPGALQTLKGLPTEVNGYYNAAWCTSLESIQYLPKIIVGSLYLEGVPFKIEDHIYLPKEIYGDLILDISTQDEANIIYENHHIQGRISMTGNPHNDSFWAFPKPGECI